MKTGIVWFRGDLRLHDHEALSKANSECTSLLPLYCFDPRDYKKVCLRRQAQKVTREKQ